MKNLMLVLLLLTACGSTQTTSPASTSHNDLDTGATLVDFVEEAAMPMLNVMADDMCACTTRACAEAVSDSAYARGQNAAQVWWSNANASGRVIAQDLQEWRDLIETDKDKASETLTAVMEARPWYPAWSDRVSTCYTLAE